MDKPKPKPKKPASRPRGRPPGPDHGLHPSLRRRLRRQRTAAAQAAAAAKADFEARFMTLCNLIAEEELKVADALKRVGLTWPQVHHHLQRDHIAKDIYRSSVNVREDTRQLLKYRRFMGNAKSFGRQLKYAREKAWPEPVIHKLESIIKDIDNGIFLQNTVFPFFRIPTRADHGTTTARHRRPSRATANQRGNAEPRARPRTCDPGGKENPANTRRD